MLLLHLQNKLRKDKATARCPLAYQIKSKPLSSASGVHRDHAPSHWSQLPLLHKPNTGQSCLTKDNHGLAHCYGSAEAPCKFSVFWKHKSSSHAAKEEHKQPAYASSSSLATLIHEDWFAVCLYDNVQLRRAGTMFPQRVRPQLLTRHKIDAQ